MTDKVNVVQSEMTKFVRSEKKGACKSRVKAGNPQCAGRESNRFESLRSVQVAAPCEDTEKNDLERTLEITTDSGADRSVSCSRKRL